MASLRPSAVGVGFGVAHLGLAALVAFGVFSVLPSRWWVVDVPAALVILLSVGSAGGVISRSPRGLKIARIGALLVLAIGLAAFAALCLAAAFVAGVQGVLGKGVAMAYLLLILPVGTWFVVLPAIELAWLHRQREP